MDLRDEEEHCTIANMADWVSFGDKAFAEIGTFEYMPQKWHGIDTRTLGFATPDGSTDIHPFFKLKAIAENREISPEDRMQAVRFMCYIPHKEGLQNCLEACKAVVFDETLDVYSRYGFFSTNEKHFKLSDEIVYLMHPLFWQTAVKKKYPLELTLLSARFVLGSYHAVDEIRQSVLDWLIDIADDENEDHRVRADAADAMICCGEWDEVEWAKEIIAKLGGSGDLYSNAENTHDETVVNSTRNILRALKAMWKAEDVAGITVEDSYKLVAGYITSHEDEEKLRGFLYRVMTDPTKWETLKMIDILALINKTIVNHESREEMSRRLFEEMIEASGTCTTGYVTRLVNVLQGFVQGREFSLRVAPKDEIRSVIFARLNAQLRNLPHSQREAVLESMIEKDKSAVNEFLFWFDLRDDLWEEYKELLPRGEFDEIAERTYDEYAGK
jgi:hypothetical protein